MMSILWMSLVACVKYGPVQVMHSDLEMKLVMAEQDPWTKNVLPMKWLQQPVTKRLLKWSSDKVARFERKNI